MKYPEEIKKGLECCADKDMQWKNCEQCSYGYFGRCSSLLHEDALEYIQYLEEQIPHWISVKERLPEEGGKYIVCTENGAVYCTRFRRFGDGGTFGVDINTNITHWMPLPEPPKEG